jgi:putative transposase
VSRYRRSLASGGVFFFTVNLAHRKCRLLVDQMDRLRLTYVHVHERYPFRTLAYCILPEHLLKQYYIARGHKGRAHPC